MNRRTLGTASAIALAALSGIAFAQTPVQTQVEKVHHEEVTTVNKNGDSATTSSSSTTKTVTTEGAAPQETGTASSDLRATGILQWTYASNKPSLREEGERPGMYIYHDKNTVWVTTIGDPAAGHDWKGSIDIIKGRFDTLQNISTGTDDHFSQEGENKIHFSFRSGKVRDTFKFNLRGGEQLRFDVMLDGQKTDRIFYGGAMAQAHGDPVIFDLNK